MTKTDIPTAVSDAYVREHEWAIDTDEAHPIDQDIVQTVCDTKMGALLLAYDLAAVQAVAVREVLPYDCEIETWITRKGRDRGDIHYFTATSITFYDLLSMVYGRYDQTTSAEDVADVVEAHTRQYLRDVHGYEGDFGGEYPSGNEHHAPTLSNAMNDGSPEEGAVTWDTKPDDVHYASTDARGLVIQAGTHDEDG